MEIFAYLMTLVWRLVNHSFVIYGYTFSYANIIYVILGASVVGVLIGKIYKD